MSDRLLADIVNLLDHPLEKRDLPKRLDAQWVIQFIHTTKDWLDWLAYRLKKKVPHDDRSPCRDCGTDTTPCDEHGRPLLGQWEWYVVKADVWLAAKMKPKGGYLCIGCLERRLKRSLTLADFKADQDASDCNTPRLADRLSIPDFLWHWRRLGRSQAAKARWKHKRKLSSPI
jgi:hypothetical protein